MPTLLRYSGLDNEASASDSAVDVVCPQLILDERSSDIQKEAVRSRVTSEVEGSVKQSWLWALTLNACPCKVTKVKIRLLTEIKGALGSIVIREAS